MGAACERRDMEGARKRGCRWPRSIDLQQPGPVLGKSREGEDQPDHDRESAEKDGDVSHLRVQAGLGDREAKAGKG